MDYNLKQYSFRTLSYDCHFPISIANGNNSFHPPFTLPNKSIYITSFYISINFPITFTTFSQFFILAMHFQASPKPMTGLNSSLLNSFNISIPDTFINHLFTKQHLHLLSPYQYSTFPQTVFLLYLTIYQINFFPFTLIFHFHNHHLLINPFPTIFKFHRPILILSTLTCIPIFPMTLST